MTNRIVLLLGLALGACAAPSTDASPVPAPARIADLEGGLLRLRTDHATVWLERPVRPDAGPESGPFVVRGWSSVPLTRVNATTPEGPLGSVHTPSPRRFEWAIDPDALTRLCDGRPAFLDVVAPATHLALRVTLAARLEAAPDDAPDIKLDPALLPLRLGDATVFRGRVEFGEGATQRRVVAPLDGSLPLEGQGEGPRTFDLRSAMLIPAALDARVPIIALARVGGRIQRRSAPVVFVVASAAVRDGDSAQAWPPEPCDLLVAACLAERSTPDIAACGDAWSVARCLDAP